MYHSIVLYVRSTLLVGCAFCSLAGATLQAGQPSHMLDFSEESTWTDNHILLAEVVSVSAVPVLRENAFGVPTRVTVRPTKHFTPDRPSFKLHDGPNVTFPSGSFALPGHVDAQPHLAAGQELIIGSPKVPRRRTIFLVPGTEGVGPDVVKTLDAIAQLRSPDATDADVVDATLHPEPIVAKYAMKRLIAADDPPRHDDFLRQLRAVRDADNTRADVALVASRLWSRLAGKPPVNCDEYAWLKTRVSRGDAVDIACFRRFLTRIVDYSDHRAETIEMLIGAARNSDLADETRLACLDALTTHPMFQYNRPDRHSDRVFDALVELVEDEREGFRFAVLHKLSFIALPILQSTQRDAQKRAYVDRVKGVLHHEIEHQTERCMRRFMEFSLERIDRYARRHLQGEDGK